MEWAKHLHPLLFLNRQQEVINCPKSFRFLCSPHTQIALTKKCCIISCVLGFRRACWINSGYDLTPLHVEFVLEKTDTETGLSLRTSFSQYQYNSTSASYSHFIHLPSTLPNDNNLQHRWISTSSLPLSLGSALTGWSLQWRGTLFFIR
jgi:hypothetical protein